MNAFMKFAEVGSQECTLSKLAKDMPYKTMDTKELDKPIIKEVQEAKKPLTDEQKEQIREQSGYSDEIIENISCWEEYEIYRDAGVKEVEVDGKKCLVREDIDFDQRDSMGRTNKERIEQGLSPINKDGNTIELHHIGQKPDSPLAELTVDEHRGKGNDSILHDKVKDSEIDRNKFNTERHNYWKERINADGGN